ncbi:MAG: methanogenesis marker 16 metalloprotein [Promethearchaeota archaeon]
MAKKRTLHEINEKIEKGTASVMTAQEFLDRLADGEKITFNDVDVITTATKGLMSGIAGIFSFRLSPPKTLRKFKEILLNGIPAFPGPCPNEYLGIADLIIYGTAQSKTNDNYSAAILFRELVEGKEIHVVAKSHEDVLIEKHLTLDDMQFARMFGTRQAIRNYNAMINPTTKPVKTIFSVLPFQPNNSEITFSGCGAMNPFQNDPNFESIGVGSKVLVNGSQGIIIGPGTRNYVKKPNMMTIADFKGMNPIYMGGFKTSFGLEPICAIAVPIPILNERIFANIVRSDRDVPLKILNVVGREKVAEITYGDVWGKNFIVKFDPDKCSRSSDCAAEKFCPTKAFSLKDGINRAKCFNCGTCAVVCKNCKDAFDIDMKSIKIDGKTIPVVLRQSDRHGAIMLARELKKQILNGTFTLKEPIESLKFADEVK